MGRADAPGRVAKLVERMARPACKGHQLS
jgi:hypothetical protein